MTIFDHAMAFLLLVGLPAYAAWAVPRLRRQIEAGDPAARLKEYAETIAVQWALAGAVATIWILHGRQASALGVAWPHGLARTISLIVAVAVVIFFTRQTKTVRTSLEAQAQVRTQLAAQPAVRVLIPRTAAEARLFHVVAITAGVCDGIIARIADTAPASAPDGDHHHLDEAGPGDEAGADGRARGRL